MADDYLFPGITPQDHEGFRRLIKNDFPQTHEQWLQLVQKRRIFEGQRGFNFRETYVNPDEFARYCRATGQDYNWASLGRIR